jgi:DNA polymerase/3'-5' exonuclease PolX
MGFCNIMQFIKNKNKSKEETQETHQKHNTARRLDIRIVPFESYGSAILYFTGSKTFNTNMRSHALKKGYSLSEFGLTKISNGELIPCSTEEEIFKIINYPYKTPVERDI